MKNKQKKSQSQFIEMVEEIRQELTEKIADISSTDEINNETIKLVKEMTTIIKELDKIIKDNKEDGISSEQQQIDFLLSLKQKSLINDSNN